MWWWNKCVSLSVLKDNINVEAHSLFAKIIFLILSKFYRDYFPAEIYKPNNLLIHNNQISNITSWFTQFIKSFRFGFLLLRISHKVLDIFSYVLHCYFYIIGCILIQLYICQILNFFNSFTQNITNFLKILFGITNYSWKFCSFGP